MARIKKFLVNVDLLHAGDFVFLGERKMNVAAVNRQDRRVLVTGRKHTKNCDIRWIDEKFLRTRPKSLVRRKIRSVHAVGSDAIDGILDWVPTKTPKPTSYLPGSPQKIAELRRRVERGESLWHHLDTTINNLCGASILPGCEQDAAKEAQRLTQAWAGCQYRHGGRNAGLIGSRAYEQPKTRDREALIRRQFKWEK